MVENQVRSGGVTNAPILASMRAVPREIFVAAGRREVAYLDSVQWLGDRVSGRFMAAPATLGKLLKLADIGAGETVLDIGAATGYSTAVIAGLAASVVGIERDAGLAAEATANLAALGLSNARIVTGEFDAPGETGFDVIVVEGALDAVPESYFGALAAGGRLVSLIRAGAVSVAHLFIKSGERITARADFNAFLPPLLSAGPNEEFVF